VKEDDDDDDVVSGIETDEGKNSASEKKISRHTE
jgi:hypothetical protein